jgi:AraC-like DNA-binding protein
MNYKLFGLIIFFVTTIFSNSLSGQNLLKKQLLITEAQNGSTSEPKESLKIALLLLKGTNTSDERVKLNLLVSKIYQTLGDYSNAANYLFDASTNIKTNSVFQSAKINLAKSSLLKSIFLYKQSEIYLNKVRIDIDKLKNSYEKKEIKTRIQLEELEVLLQKQEYKKANEFISKNNCNAILLQGNEFRKHFLLIQSKINVNLGNFKSSNSNLGELTKLLNKKDQYFELQVWNEIAKNYFYQQNYSKAIEYSLKAKEILVQLDNLYLLESSTETLVLSYLAQNNDQEYKLLHTKLLTIKSEIEKKEKETVNTVYNLINVEFQANYAEQKTKFNNKLFISIGFFVSVLIVFVLLWYRKYSTQRRLTEILSYLEVTNRTIIDKAEKNKFNNKKNSISVETEQIILNKLKKFETTTKFTNKDISLAVLAGQFETNTKYLSEIINKHYQVNFNTYINKLRINFIIDKLKSDHNFCNYKISYLAELSGFSSHSSFATVFKSVSGITPITFIDLLKNEKKDSNIKLSENE